MSRISIRIPKNLINNTVNKLGEIGNFQPIISNEEYKLDNLSEDLISFKDFLNQINDLKSRISNFLSNYENKDKPKELSKHIIKGGSFLEIYNKILNDFTIIETEFNKYKENILDLNRKIKRLNFLKTIFQNFLDLDIDLTFLKDLKSINVNFGIIFTRNIPNLKRSLKNYNKIIYDEQISETQSFFMIIYPVGITSSIIKILRDYHIIFIENVHELEIDRVNEIKEDINQINNRINDLNVLKNSIIDENFVKIYAYYEILKNIKKIVYLQKNTHFAKKYPNIDGFLFKEDDKTPENLTLQNIENIVGFWNITRYKKKYVYIDGWILEKEKKEFIEKVLEKIDGNLKILENNIDQTEEKPPTKIEYPKIIRSFGMLVNLYGPSNYYEIDPTFLTFFTFPILFGLMFGDIGQGISLFIGGIIFYFLLKTKPAYKKLSMIIAICGIYSMITGFLYGEFFGFDIFTPILFNPYHDPLTALKFSIVIGVIIICSGIVLSVVNHLINKRYIKIFLVSIPKIVLYSSTVYIVLVLGFDFTIWFSGPIFIPLISILIIFLGPTISKIIFPSKFFNKETKSEVFSESFLDIAETAISLISNTVSFARIFVISIIHISLMLVVNKISLMIISNTNLFITILGYFILVVGNILVILFEIIMVLTQDLRLHYYEWFNKFYKDGGIKFIPFRINEKYSQIKIEKK